MTVYEAAYTTTSYEIVDTPFSQGDHEEAHYDPFLEVPYQWQNPRFKASRSALEQRMMIVPALAGLMVILLGIFALPHVVSGAANDNVTGIGAAAQQGSTVVETNEGGNGRFPLIFRQPLPRLLQRSSALGTTNHELGSTLQP